MLVNARFLPHDLLMEILSRLPVRHILRLRCVCKSWRALIDDINFIKRHYQLQRSICKEHGDIPIISTDVSIASEAMMFHVSLLSKQNGDVLLDLTADLIHDSAASFANTSPEFFDSGLFVGVANGVVCFVWGLQNLGLWNPATREFKAIQPWLNHWSYQKQYYFDLLGFGFDSISNDFKILKGICCDDNTTFYHEVYSLATNSWKRLTELSPLVRSFRSRPFMQAYLNGVCYWCYDHCGTPVILSFNFSTEVFEVFNPPQNAIGSKIEYEYTWDITLYGECLAFVVRRSELGKAVCNFDVWVVTKFHDNSGIPASWQHLLTIRPFPSCHDLCLGAFRMDGDVLFINNPQNEEESVLYNPSTGMFKELGTCLPTSYNYIESLFPLSRRLFRGPGLSGSYLLEC